LELAEDAIRELELAQVASINNSYEQPDPDLNSAEDEEIFKMGNDICVAQDLAAMAAEGFTAEQIAKQASSILAAQPCQYADFRENDKKLREGLASSISDRMAASSNEMAPPGLPVKAAPKPKVKDTVPTKAGPPVMLPSGAVVPYAQAPQAAKAASPPPTPTKAPPVISTERARLAQGERWDDAAAKVYSDTLVMIKAKAAKNPPPAKGPSAGIPNHPPNSATVSSWRTSSGTEPA